MGTHENIKVVYDTNHFKTANEYLRAGWILIDTYKTSVMRDEFLNYVLAWDKDEEPVYPPQYTNVIR